MLNKIKLKWKIFAYILLFSAVVLTVVVIFQILMLESVYRSTKEKNVINLTEKVSTLVTKNDPSLYDDLNNISLESDTAIYIIRPTTEVSFGVPSVYYEEILHKYFEIMNQAKNMDGIFYLNFEKFKEAPGPGAYVMEDQSVSSTSTNIICCKLAYNKNETILVVIDSRLVPVGPVGETLKKQLFYICIIVCFLSIGVALLISNNVSKPLRKMTDSAKMLAEGERDITFDAKGFQEITDLNKTLNYAVDELNKTTTLQRELLANISHDLKTPLTLISGYAEMMKDMKEEITDENLQLIVDESNRLNILVNDLLNLSRLQAKTEVFNVHPVNVTKLLTSIVQREQMFRQKDGFTINFKEPTDVFINCDEHKIEQVIYNFLSNAINYSGDSKQIEVDTEIVENKIKISFTDHGIGIKEEDVPVIWNRYYRVDKTLQRSHKGTGLGLAIVKEILEYHKFEYGVESKLNKGSTFYFVATIVNE